MSGIQFHRVSPIAGIPRGFIKDALQKVKECGMREEAEEATGGKGEDLGHFQQRRWTKPKKKKKKNQVYYWIICKSRC